MFAGRLHPVTSAAISLGLHCFEPFDLDGDAARNILILGDSVFEALLRLCWSGIVALIMLFRLRSVQKLLDSKTIHDRGRALFRAVSKGGVGIWEQPPSAMSWLEEANFQMLRDHQCALG